MRRHWWQGSLPALSLPAPGCCLNHDFSILCQAPAGVKPRAVPTVPLAGWLSPPKSPPPLVKGIKGGHGAELGSDITVSKLRPHCDRALEISFSLCLVSMGRNPELQQLADMLPCPNCCWTNSGWWRSRYQVARGWTSASGARR